MNIAIRADSSTQIGSGHIMRCLTLADELERHGANVFFICRELSGCMISFIEDRDYIVYRLTSNKNEPRTRVTPNLIEYADWIDVSWENDAHETLMVFKEEIDGCDLLIVDHYAIDYRWEALVRPFVNKIMVIDDIADRSHDCDFLLDQNFYHDMDKRYGSLVPDNCQLLLGPKYALLRPEFISIKKNKLERDGNIRRVLIFFGGSDYTNETAKALRALKSINNLAIAVDVVVGKMNPHREDIKNMCSGMSNCSFFYQISNMAELMNSADLMIGAGGSTSWERCCLGLPGIVASIAINQVKMTEDLAELGVIYYLGQSTETSIDSYQNAFMALFQSPWIIRMFSKKGVALVDGQGCRRVLSTLISPEIDLRPALLEDLESVFEWRNAPETRRFIFDQNPIEPEDHKIWFVCKLSDPNCKLLIGIEKMNNEPVGVLRYDLIKDVAVVSVYLVPNQYGKGMGHFLLVEGTRWIMENLPNIIRIDAEIIQGNKASENAFMKAGYRISHSTYCFNIER